jgi:hypothetical protein
MKEKERLIEAFNDLISEPEVMQKTGYSKEGLRKLRQKGKLNWTTLTGKKIMYRKSDLAKLFNL